MCDCTAVLQLHNSQQTLWNDEHSGCPPDRQTAAGPDRAAAVAAILRGWKRAGADPVGQAQSGPNWARSSRRISSSVTGSVRKGVPSSFQSSISPVEI